MRHNGGGGGGGGGKRLWEGRAEFKSGSGITGRGSASEKGMRIVSILAYNAKTARIGLLLR